MLGRILARWLGEDGLRRIGQMAREGLGTGRIAGRVGVTEKQLLRAARRHPQLGEALRAGEVAYEAVVGSMWKLSTGYTVEVTRHFKEVRREYGPDGKKIAEVETAIPRVDEVYVQPSVTAASFWLKEYRPEGYGKGAEPQEALIGAARALLEEVRAEAVRAGTASPPYAPPDEEGSA